MWGADDPDERKPMVWADLRYDDETTHPFGRPRRRDRVAPDTALFRVYRDLIALRKQHLRLFVDGTLNWLLTDDARGLLAYERVLGDQRAIVAFNVSDAPQEISLAADGRLSCSPSRRAGRRPSPTGRSRPSCRRGRRGCGSGSDLNCAPRKHGRHGSCTEGESEQDSLDAVGENGDVEVHQKTGGQPCKRM